MAKQSEWVYCEDTTKSHRLGQEIACLEKIDVISKAEGAKKTHFKSEIALNLDNYEEKLARKEKRDARPTMDMSFGITKGKSKKMVLADYKLNCIKPNNLSKTEIEAKIAYSRALLGSQPIIQFENLFIFGQNKRAQGERVLRQFFQNKRTCLALDINQLYTSYFS